MRWIGTNALCAACDPRARRAKLTDAAAEPEAAQSRWPTLDASASDQRVSREHAVLGRQCPLDRLAQAARLDREGLPGSRIVHDGLVAQALDHRADDPCVSRRQHAEEAGARHAG